MQARWPACVEQTAAAHLENPPFSPPPGECSPHPGRRPKTGEELSPICSSREPELPCFGPSPHPEEGAPGVGRASLPTGEDGTPHPGEPLSPPGEGRLPAGEGRLPTREGRLPTLEASLPTREAGLPTRETELPTREGHLPTPGGAAPRSGRGCSPPGRRVLPGGEEVLPGWGRGCSRVGRALRSRVGRGAGAPRLPNETPCQPHGCACRISSPSGPPRSSRTPTSCQL